MRRDKKAAQKKKARANARKATQSQENRSFAALLKLAHAGDFGPAFMSPEWRDEDLPPRLVTVVITRKLPKDAFAFHAMVVDRTCLGVKNAFTHAPVSRRELDDFLARVGKHHVGPMEEVPVATAQSLAIHAIAFAEEYGFEPHRDYDTFMLQPFPDEPEETPLWKPDIPFYVPGPDDDVDAILEHLEEACGPDGFEFGHPGEDDLSARDEIRPSRKPDEQKLFNAINAWLQDLQAEEGDRLDMTTAFAQYIHAVSGEPVNRNAPIDGRHWSSLPLFWAGLFRPIGARTGLDHARESKATAGHGAELDRAERTRAVLFDVLGVDSAREVAIGRDVFEGTRIDVRLEPEMLSKLTRWTRMFGYVTPMDDATWYPPSTLLGHPWLRNVEPSEAIARANELLAELGIDERIDPKDTRRGLLRYGALVHGVLHRSIAPNAEQKAEAEAPIYCVSSDDERYELHEARLDLGAARAKQLTAALSSADDFVEDADGFAWSGRPTAEVTITDEHLASISPLERGRFRIMTNSRERFERFLGRLSSLAETRLEPKDVNVIRPWETSPRVVAEEVPGCRKVVVGLQGLEPDSSGVDGATLDHVRRALSDDVPSLGGRPVDLVKDAAGRERVERWLEEQELHGVPNGESAFLDLDDVRRELGLPAVL